MNRYAHTPSPNPDFTALSQRLSAAIDAGDPVVTDRAIRLARNRGDHAEAERLTAEYWRIQGSANGPENGAQTRAAALAGIPLDERIGR